MALDFDRQRIVIRERGILEIMDLALAVIRELGWPLLLAFVIGVAPMLALNAWLLDDLLIDALEVEFNGAFNYCYWLTVLMILEAPLATAPATLLLGRAMFGQPISLAVVFRQLVKALPQLFWFQLVVRGLLMLVCAAVPVLPYLCWPYLSEIILLERNPLLRRGTDRMTTLRRARGLHSGVFGDLLGRWIVSILMGGLLAASLWLSTQVLLSQLTGWWPTLKTSYLFYLPLSLWTAVCLMTVVRFLGYLDLRIRREGWEVELAMRAEGARLMRKPG